MQTTLFNTDSLPAPRLMGWSRFYQTFCLLVKRNPSTTGTAKHESLAFNFFKSLYRAFAIGLISKVMAMVKLCQIERQMLFADVVERSNNSTLKQAEISFNTIRSNEPVIFTASIFTHAMFYRVMAIVCSNGIIAGILVRMNFSIRFHIFVNDRLEVFARHRLHDLATDSTATFEQ